MPILVPGQPRIKLLNSDGATANVLYLPSADRNDGLVFEWIEKSHNKTMIDGSELCRRYGWLPQLTLKWDFYNDVRPRNGLSIGSSNGQVADLPALLAILDAPIGRIRVSPGPTGGGFSVNQVTVGPMGRLGSNGVAKGLKIVFRGGSIHAARVLGEF